MNVNRVRRCRTSGDDKTIDHSLPVAEMQDDRADDVNRSTKRSLVYRRPALDFGRFHLRLLVESPADLVRELGREVPQLSLKRFAATKTSTCWHYPPAPVRFLPAPVRS